MRDFIVSFALVKALAIPNVPGIIFFRKVYTYSDTKDCQKTKPNSSNPIVLHKISLCLYRDMLMPFEGALTDSIAYCGHPGLFQEEILGSS